MSSGFPRRIKAVLVSRRAPDCRVEPATRDGGHADRDASGSKLAVIW